MALCAMHFDTRRHDAMRKIYATLLLLRFHAAMLIRHAALMRAAMPAALPLRAAAADTLARR